MRTTDVVEARTNVGERLVGRERELDLVLAAVAAGRDLVLEGPPGTSKTTMLTAITSEWGIPLLFVEGNADLTPAKLIGHHNPARVLREDYSADNFVPGPLTEAMRQGGFLYIEEFNRAPDDTLNTLLTAMADRRLTIPRVGTVEALPTFRIIASMNPYDNVGTTRLSSSVHDRLCRLAVDYQDDAAERGIVALRTSLPLAPYSPAAAPEPTAPHSPAAAPEPTAPHSPAAAPEPTAASETLAGSLVADAVAVTRATRTHPDVRQGSSVRGAIDCALVAIQLGTLRDLGPESKVTRASDEVYARLVLDAMFVALSGRIQLDEAAETTPERVLTEIWEDHFILNPSAAQPG